MQAADAITMPVAGRRLIRWLLAALGLLCVGIGACGVFIPGLPTTVFLIIATACFTKSCPWLEARLIRNRFFAPFLVYIDRSAPMPPRARFAAIATMWLFVTLAIVLIWSRTAIDPRSVVVIAAIALSAVAGTVFIVRWNRAVRCPAS